MALEEEEVTEHYCWIYIKETNAGRTILNPLTRFKKKKENHYDFCGLRMKPDMRTDPKE